jgi:hypothetical protein
VKTKDMLGQQYGVGDFVVYATTSGRSPVQKYARVEKVEMVDALDWDDQPTGKKRLRVGVREILNGRGFDRYDSYDWAKRTYDPSKVRITYLMPENVVKATAPEGEAA